MQAPRPPLASASPHGLIVDPGLGLHDPPCAVFVPTPGVRRTVLLDLPSKTAQL